MAGRLRLPSPRPPRDEARMTLIEHLEELRSRIIKVALVFIAAAVVAAFFVPQIFEWLLKPSGLERLNNLSPAQGLITDMKLVLYAAFGYYVVLPVGLEFLLNYANDRYNEMITADTYLPFVTRFLLAFGIVFELPAATYVGAKLGLVTASFLKRYRRHAIVVNAVLAAALTPGQDPFSMILMAIPMVLMYEISILIARFVNPGLTEEPLSEEEQDL